MADQRHSHPGESEQRRGWHVFQVLLVQGMVEAYA